MPTPHDTWADCYDEVNASTFGELLDEMTTRNLAYIKRLVSRPGRILDAGTGTGRLAIPLKQQGYNVVAFDASGRMVARHLEKAAALGLEYPVLQATMQDFDPPSPDFDLVICLHTVIAYLTTEDDLGQAANCFARALRSGGRVLLDFPTSGLFASHTYEQDGFRREVEIVPKGDALFTYRERTTLGGEAGHRYEDEFDLRAWTVDQVQAAFSRAGLPACENVTGQFAGFGHHYLLLSHGDSDG